MGIGAEGTGAADGLTPGLSRTAQGQQVEEGALESPGYGPQEEGWRNDSQGRTGGTSSGLVVPEKHLPWIPAPSRTHLSPFHSLKK